LNAHAIHHAPYGSMAYPSGTDRLTVMLRCGRGDFKRVIVAYRDRYAGPRPSRQQRLLLTGSDELFDYWRGDLVLCTRRPSYYFILDNGAKRFWYGEGGLSADRATALNEQWCFVYPYLWWTQDADPPAWAREAIVYQIFLDRFASGDMANKPPDARTWGRRPTRNAVFGGDLQGIFTHLNHLVHLGVNCLYLTPIFQSPSNHKYDTTDYLQIDRAFGDEQSARRLVAHCHARGIRVILDGVFNHCGYEFAPFQDVIANGPDSPYASWFRVYDYPVGPSSGGTPNYQTFANGIWRMPKLMTDNPVVREFLIDAAAYWTRQLEIDGWRLDVGEEVHPEFCRDFRRRIRAINPEAWIVGEILHEASVWLQGDQMDAVMNYPWYNLCLSFFARQEISVKAFADTLARLRMRYRRSVTEVNWNLLDSHDRPRLVTACRGDKSALKLATTFQFTYPGVPYVYYGTEVGLPGGNDPDCRRCMPWDQAEWDLDLLEHYRTLIELRKRFPVFSRGEHTELIADASSGMYAFARWDSEACALVLLNNGGESANLAMDGLLSAVCQMGLGGWKAFSLCFATIRPSPTAELPVRLERKTTGRRSDRGPVICLPARSAAVYTSAV